MFARTRKVTKGGKTYEYVHLVETTRNEDGVLRQRMIASLGKKGEVKPEEIDRLVASIRRVAGLEQAPPAPPVPESAVAASEAGAFTDGGPAGLRGTTRCA